MNINKWLLGILLIITSTLHSQNVIVAQEFFENKSHTFSSTNMWRITKDYSFAGKSAIWGSVPHYNGDSIVLTTPIYDFTNYSNVLLRFYHICKVSPSDEVRIEFRIDLLGQAGQWKPLPFASYEGNAKNYNTRGFNSDSYEEWKSEDSTILPEENWWKQECFDLSNYVSYDKAQFRFIIKKKNVLGSNIAYGWLIDNVQFVAANQEIKPPKIEFLHPLIKDTLCNTGPYTIYAKITSQTAAPLKQTYFIYNQHINNSITTDTLPMIAFEGDSLWQATLPQFIKNSLVHYIIIAEDSLNNHATATSSYVISDCQNNFITEEVVIGDKKTLFNSAPIVTYYNYSWSKQLYLSKEINKTNQGGVITNLAWECNTSAPDNYTNQICYLAAVDEDVLTINYTDPSAIGAQQVWSGTLHLQQGWCDITFKQPFYLPPNKNLLIIWHNKHGNSNNEHQFYYSSTSSVRCVYEMADNAFPYNSGSYSSYNLPNLRLKFQKTSLPNYSVTLQSIDTPLLSNENYNIKLPVTVTIRNKGSHRLDSCTINWTLNGVSQPEYVVVLDTALEWDFQKQITIGSYSPSPNKFDTLVIWVSLPNGFVDKITYDDTIEKIVYNCATPLSGDYIIGNDRFKTVSEALQVLKLCGVNSDVRFLLPSGNYHQHWDFSNISDILGQYSLTITSLKKNKDSVIVYAEQPNVIGNTRNLTINYITFLRDTASGFIFAGNCDNIEISHCNILLDTTSSVSEAPFGQNAGTGFLNNIRIRNNYMTGGYFGIILQGMNTTQKSTNLLIDSNIIENSYFYGIYNYCGEAKIEANIIRSRIAFTNNSFYGIRSYYAEGTIIGNKIWQRSNTIISSCGISLYYHNHGDSTNDLIANNEISVFTTQNFYGLYVGYSSADIVHNSIHVTSTGSGNGIYVLSHSSNQLTIQNNDVVLNQGYPILFTSTNYMNRLRCIGNNFYSTTALAYVGRAIYDITTLQQLFGNDHTTVSIVPQYINATENLQWIDYSTNNIQLSTLATTDIYGEKRGGITGRGAYRGIAPQETDAMISSLIGFQHDLILQTTDSLSVVVINAGILPLDSFDIIWQINSDTAQHICLHRQLLAGESDTICLGHFASTFGNINFKIIVAAINDNYPDNDTLVGMLWKCFPNGLQGNYTIGDTGDFPSLSLAIEKIKVCGMGADVVLSLQSGTYIESCDLQDINLHSNGYTLTINSLNKNKTDVVIGSAGSVIYLGKTDNVVIENLTIDATNAIYGIQFTSSCNNIVIRNCIILSDETNSLTSVPIYKDNNTGICNNIYIINNHIYGGFRGLYFYVGTSTSAFGTNIVIDSNIFENQYEYGMYLYYGDSISLTNNKIYSRKKMPSEYWYAIWVQCVNVNILSNCIIQRSADIIYPYGIYGNTINIGNWNALIANNIIDIQTPNAQAGIHLLNFRAEIFHNTIRVVGELGRGIYLGTGSLRRVKNNIIVTQGKSAYPIYLNNPFSINNDDIDANNLVGSSYVGYSSGARKTIIDWQKVITTDSHSVNIIPHFISKDNLILKDSIGLSVKSLKQIPKDILGQERDSITSMGAYHYWNRQHDAYPEQFVNLLNGYPKGDNVPIKIVIVNNGLNPLTSLSIHCKINELELPVYQWTGNLIQFASDTITLTTITSYSDIYNIKVFTSLPNGVGDIYPDLDTIVANIYSCDSILNGYYTIGAGGDFANLTIALEKAVACGIGQHLYFALMDTQYVHENLFTNFSTNTSNTLLTITNYDNNKAVILSETAPVVLLQNIENVMFKNIIFGNGTKDVVIRFEGNCSNITFDSCEFLGNVKTINRRAKTIEYTGSDIDKTLIKNITFSNNLINGGYYNLYFTYAQQSAQNMSDSNGITIIGNRFTNAYYSAIYSDYYAYFRCINYNTITSRSNSAAFLGIFLSNFQSPRQIIGNRINIVGTAEVMGINLTNFHNLNAYGASTAGLLANNEIIAQSTSSNYSVYGINLNNSPHYYVYNNSIFSKSNNNLARGIYVRGSNNKAFCDIEYNNIMVQGKEIAYALYIDDTNNVYGKIDYNNYFTNSKYLGFIQSEKTSLKEMQKYQNANSTNENPYFENPEYSLVLPDTVLLLCPRNDSVLTDIQGNNRNIVTNKGAYTFSILSSDLALQNLEVQNTIAGNTSKAVLTVKNIGQNNIDTLIYQMELNGVTILQDTINQTIPFLSTETIILPEFYPIAGKNQLKVYLINTNNQFFDDNPLNDTIQCEFFVCDSMLSGIYTIGNNADFIDKEDFENQLLLCGAKDAITLKLKDGSYSGSWNLGQWKSALKQLPLLITSESENAELVKLTSSQNTIILNDNQNITFENITIKNQNAYVVTIQNGAKNIVFNHCKLLSDTTTSSPNKACIYKENDNGLIDSIFLKNSLLNGGYYGFCFEGKLSSIYRTSLYIDSNTFVNQANSAIRIKCADFVSVICNNILSRKDNVNAYWTAINIDSVNANIFANSIKQRISTIGYPCGISASFCGSKRYKTQIINNTIQLYNNVTAIGIDMGFTHADIFHNTIKINELGDNRGISINALSECKIAIKNNIIDLFSGYPIYLLDTFSMYNLEFAYNNYYSPDAIAYASKKIVSLASWQQLIPNDTNSISILPQYEESLLKPKTILPYLCPRINTVDKDINNCLRDSCTIMGAYSQTTSTFDLALVSFKNIPTSLIAKQQIPLEVEIINLGNTNISSATISWSLNGQKQSSFHWSTNTPLNIYSKNNLVIDTLIIPDTVFTLAVWIDSVNNYCCDNKLENDTLVADFSVTPLAEFVSPRVPKCLYGLSFDVFTRISEGSGATIHQPTMTVTTYMDSVLISQEILPMEPYDNDIWITSVSPKYYGAKIYYSTTIDDTLGNSIILFDSTYLLYAQDSSVVQIGNASLSKNVTPMSTTKGYSWSQQLYLAKEIQANGNGGQITHIKWQYLYPDGFAYDNQACYFLITDDSVLTGKYIDVHDMQQVWFGSLPFEQGWCEIELFQPFLLPAGKNLLVIWHHQHGGEMQPLSNFAHHITSQIRCVYAESNTAFPSGNGTTSLYRPNIQIVLVSPYESYSENNLALTEIVLPDYNNNFCNPEYMPISVKLANLSAEHYNFSTNNVTLHLNINSPIQITKTITLDKGILSSKKTINVTLINDLPIKVSGIYDIKIWIEAIDAIAYDDTIEKQYISPHINLPIDEMFSQYYSPILRRTENNSIDGWIIKNTTASGNVNPQYGNGLLAFNGSRGAMSRLLTQQINLKNALHPKLEFWYWHDTNASIMDYTDIRLTFDAGKTYHTLTSLFKNNETDMGWKHYSFSLDSFIGHSCVFILFESMRASSLIFDGEQFIDRILITAEQDIAIGAIAIDDISSCNFSQKEFGIFIKNTSNKKVDFSVTPTSLIANITGSKSISYNIDITNGIVEPWDSLFVLLDTNFNFEIGTYCFDIQIIKPIDNINTNDSLVDTLIINPNIMVKLQQFTNGINLNNCLPFGTYINQKLSILNNGNLDFENIVITLNIYNVNGLLDTSLVDTLYGIFSVGETIDFTSSKSYIVPNDEIYSVEAIVFPSCNPNMYYKDSIIECIDKNDIAILAFVSPDSTEKCSTIGTQKSIIVNLMNNNPNEDIFAVDIFAHLLVLDDTIFSWKETIDNIPAQKNINYQFSHPFVVPQANNYSIVTFVDKRDANTINDTLKITKCVDLEVIELKNDIFTMEQNIPNPTNEKTKIDYNVPKEGNIVFTIASTIGQIVYTKHFYTTAGKHSITIDITNLATGIYFYTIDFYGHRITKKMTIKR